MHETFMIAPADARQGVVVPRGASPAHSRPASAKIAIPNSAEPL